jgi:hypothetical protein
VGRRKPGGRQPAPCARAGPCPLRAARGADDALHVDRVIAATGYRPAATSLPFLDPALRARVRTEAGAPALDRGFQSSVPGLHFTGYAAAASFGPLMRFVHGTRFASRQLAAAVR